MRLGMELTEENIKSLGDDVLDQYFLLNRVKIMQAYADQELAKLDKKWREETDNPDGLRDDEPPEESEADKKNKEIDEEVSRDLGDV